MSMICTITTMLTITSGRPSELVRSLGMINTMSVRHLRIMTHSHFWHTDDCISELVRKFGSLQYLETLEIVGDSYPTLLTLSEFLMFLHSSTCVLQTLTVNVSPPFPCQYRIQDRSFLTNKILHLIFDCKTLVNITFHSENVSVRNDETKIHQEDKWVKGLNVKARSLIRNHGTRESSRL
jgi:hypothetical protein